MLNSRKYGTNFKQLYHKEICVNVKTLRKAWDQI